MLYALAIIVGLAVGFLVAWLLATQRTRSQFAKIIEDAQIRASAAEGKAGALEATLQEFRTQADQRSQKAAEDFEKLRERLSAEEKARVKAETERKEALTRLEEEKTLLADARAKLTDAFKAVASDTLSSNSQQFLSLAKQALDTVIADAKGDLGRRQEAIDGLVRPLSDSLKTFEQHVRALESNRQQAYTSLEEHLKSLTTTQQQLQKETTNLVTALRRPEVRGRWGEMTLRRVVELAGMSEHCDFAEQVSINTEEGRYRPDLIVHLPSDRLIIVDCKVPLDAYLNALGATSEEERRKLLTQHAQQLRSHMNDLIRKAYDQKFKPTPEFVVMFIPGEAFFAEAAHSDLSLIEDGMQKGVVPASPTTLIALLRAVAYGWRQEQIAQSAHDISKLGKELYERMGRVAEYINGIGMGLQKANAEYDRAARSLETRVLPAARKFKELGVTTADDIVELTPLEIVPRHVALPEMTTTENGDK